MLYFCSKNLEAKSFLREKHLEVVVVASSFQKKNKKRNFWQCFFDQINFKNSVLFSNVFENLRGRITSETPEFVLLALCNSPIKFVLSKNSGLLVIKCFDSYLALSFKIKVGTFDTYSFCDPGNCNSLH